LHRGGSHVAPPPPHPNPVVFQPTATRCYYSRCCLISGFVTDCTAASRCAAPCCQTHSLVHFLHPSFENRQRRWVHRENHSEFTIAEKRYIGTSESTNTVLRSWESFIFIFTELFINLFSEISICISLRKKVNLDSFYNTSYSYNVG